MKRFTSSLILITFALLLSACGFQPRGQAPSLSGVPSPLYISGIPQYSPLHLAITKQLQKSGLTLTEDGNSASSLLVLRNPKSNERLLSVDSRNRAVEFELEESVQFALRSKSQGEIVDQQTVRVVRILFRPQNQILAGEREEEKLRKAMYEDLANRIIKRLTAQY